jgi:hypothetical protein
LTIILKRQKILITIRRLLGAGELDSNTLENLDKAALYFIAVMSVFIVGRLGKIIYLLEENNKRRDK